MNLGLDIKIFCFHQLILVYHQDKHVIPTSYSVNWYVHTLQLQKKGRVLKKPVIRYATYSAITTSEIIHILHRITHCNS